MPEQVPPEVKKVRSDELLDRAVQWKKAFRKQQETEEMVILPEEYETIGGERLLVGYNERYVRYGVPESLAREKAFVPGVPARVRLAELRDTSDVAGES